MTDEAQIAHDRLHKIIPAIEKNWANGGRDGNGEVHLYPTVDQANDLADKLEALARVEAVWKDGGLGLLDRRMLRRAIDGIKPTGTDAGHESGVDHD